ncbi:MAG: hypothetical protein Q9224_002506, partial [Gallowayella concinna]
GAHSLNEDIGLFDASFFNVSPNEAKAMDPQQRLLLDVIYEALENGGVTLEGIAGTSTGVYVGAAQIDYSSLLFEDVEDLPLYQSTGTSANILSNRISYVFDLKGPSITMDTACSSSLAALHTACQSLRTGEVTQAIVCGAHIMLSPDTMVGMSMLKLFGEEGRSYTFDSRATGYGRGEGIVSLLIKPLDAAVRDSDNIRAIIRNTGVNQDGKTNGITYPSCEAQIKLMHSVYSAAGLDPTATDYVEAHGTGTAAGDPVEAEAISRVFTDGRSIDAPLIVGSLKTNVGHLEAAGGLTGMVKVIYALETGLIPPNINFDVPNPAVPLADCKLKVRLSTCSSSLGLSDLGTNAHVILEQYTGDQTSNGYPHTEELNGHSMNVTLEAQSRDTSMDSDSVMTPESLGEPHKSRRRLLVFSAGDKTSLQHYIDRIASYLSGNKLSDDEALMDRLAFTLGSRRSALSWREAVAASTPAELSELLSGTPANSARSFDKPALGFVFTGQGAQWPAISRELFIYPVFAKSMQESDAYLRDCGADWSLLACVNALSLVTASGDERGISRLQTITEQESLFNRRLKVDVAYHSPHMQDISPQYLSSLESVEPQQVHNVEFHSSVRGHQIDTRSLDAAYWVENMTSPVQFLDAVQGMFGEPRRPDALIEIGPHSTLESPIRDIMKSNSQWSSKNAILHELPVTPTSQYKLRHVKIDRSMVLREDFATEVSLVMRPQKEGSRSGSSAWNEFRVFSWTHEGGWVEHCYGLISITRGDQEPNPINGARQAEDEKQYYKDAIATMKDSCTKTLATSDIYSRFSRGGLEFGPAFRNVSAAHAAKGHSTGTITIPNTAMKMPNQHEDVHIIHPGTFDACFQVTDFAAGAGDLTRSDIHVPTFVQEITVCHALPRSPGYQLDCYARASPITNASQLDNHASFFVVDSQSTADPLIRVEGLVMTKLPEQILNVADTGERGLCYKLSWEPYLDLLKAEDFRTIFDGPIHHMGSAPQINNLERAAFAHIKSTVAEITAQEATSFPPHLQKLYRVLSSLLESGHRGNLPFQTRHWLESGEAENDEFLRSLESSDECVRLVCNMGRNLSSIFRQETEPLSIMLHDNMLKNYYRQNDIVNWCYERTASIIGKLAHEKPNMRIIELGAGTGGATMPMLRKLGHRFAHLDFTDLSTGFFESAKAEQTAWAERISYQKLDIEQDPVSQGFQPESYDLVVDTNVLHATENIAKTTRNIRRLVKPGGKVLIVEITGQTLSSLVIFGTLPGWWLGEEPERRDGPFISELQWHTVLRDNGFSGVDGSVQINDFSHSIVSVMLTTALTEKKPIIPAVGVVRPRLGKDEPLINILSGLLSSRSGQALSAGQLLEADLADRYTIVVAMDDSLWLDMDETGLRRMQDIFQSARGILWVLRGASSQHPTANMIAGVARSIRSENAGLRVSTIDFDGKDRLPDAKVAELILQLADHIFDQRTSKIGADMDFLERNGVLHILRALGDKQKDDYVIRETRPPVPGPGQLVQDGRHLKMKLGQVGLLDSIYFEGNETLQLPLADDEVEIVINATGMNFKDVMISLGQIPYHDLGLECSGVVSGVGCGVLDIRVGDRVFGMAKGAYASSVRVKDSMVAGMPPDITFSQAASIPVVFCTAQYALIDMGRLCKGDKVLIHAAAGGVG